MKINWYPGHMKKATDNILMLAKNINIILNVMDARAIYSSNNKELNSLLIKKNIKIINIVNKCDLIPEEELLKWKHKCKSWIFVARNLFPTQKILNRIKKIKINSYYKNCMVIGMPNVGKSTIINLLVGKKIRDTRNVPGVTKTNTKSHIVDNIYIYDSPGISYKNITSNDIGYKLVLINSIKYEVVPLDSVLQFAFNFLKIHNKKFLSLIVDSDILINCNFTNYLILLQEKLNTTNENKIEEFFYQKIRNSKRIIWDYC